MPHIRSTGAGQGLRPPPTGTRVVDVEGQQADIVSMTQSEAGMQAVLRTEEGEELMLPADLLHLQDDGAYRTEFAFRALHPERSAEGMAGDGARLQEQLVIPVLQEEVGIAKRTMETGRGLRIVKSVDEEEVVLKQPLLQEELVVERVPINIFLQPDDNPVPRYEGATYIVPVVEEVLVVEKRLRLKEEVRIVRRKRAIEEEHKVMVRAERVSVEPFDDGERRPVEGKPGESGGANQGEPDPDHVAR